MPIRIVGGTPNHSRPGLCESCEYSQIMRNDKGDVRTRCRVDPAFWVNIKVRECTDFSQLNQPHGLLYSTAWVLARRWPSKEKPKEQPPLRFVPPGEGY